MGMSKRDIQQRVAMVKGVKSLLDTEINRAGIKDFDAVELAFYCHDCGVDWPLVRIAGYTLKCGNCGKEITLVPRVRQDPDW